MFAFIKLVLTAHEIIVRELADLPGVIGNGQTINEVRNTGNTLLIN